MPDQGTVFGATALDGNKDLNSKDMDSALIGTLVGEGRKYASIEDLAKAYMEADGFIETLKTENQSYRAKLESSKTIDDVLERLNAKGGTVEDKPTSISAPDIAKIVRETVTGLETERTKTENLLKADAKMKGLYGEKAQEVFNSEAKNPATKAALIALAEVDPDKFVALFDKKEAASTGTAASGGGYNTAALGQSTTPNTGDPSTQAYYSEMRRKNPKLYYSSAFQLQMHKAAQTNPEKFFKT